MMYGRFFDMGQGVFNRPLEGVHGNGLAVLSRINGRFRRFQDADTLECRDFNHLTAQFSGQLLDVDFVSALFHGIHHIDGDNNRDSKFGQLGGQIQVPLQVRAVNDVQNRIGALGNQIISRHHFLQRIGGK